MDENLELEKIYSLMRPRRICICKSVSESDLVSCIHKGAHTLEDVISQTGASTNCGSCSSMVAYIFEKEMQKIKSSQ